MEGCNFLDLFAGSGSAGIEAISRGADIVYFVDKSIKSIKLINENINLLNFKNAGMDCDYKILKSDVIDFLKKNIDLIFNIVFIDPPYSISFFTISEVFRLLAKSNFVNKNTIFIYEYFFKRNTDEEISGFEIVKKSFFGDKIVCYLEL